MFFYAKIMKWILWISLGKIAKVSIWSLLVHIAYALFETMIISGEWIMKVVSDFLKEAPKGFNTLGARTSFLGQGLKKRF
jgi:hypothetical protein